MRLFWRRANERAEQHETQAWTTAWHQAVRARDETALQMLEVQTAQRRDAGRDVELEEEMIDGARRAIALARDIAAAGLPTLLTSHRVVGTDACHFSAPASLADDPAQPSGRLLLTASRGIFIGGPKLIQIPWHSVKDAQDRERDILLIRGADEGIRFRCNTYGDALAGVLVAEHLVQRARRI
jgi:hypothetical protein